MEYRRLGKSGLKVSELSLGSWVTFSKQVDEKEALALMGLAYDEGVNFFDNAEGYEAGESEALMGAALSKLGWSRDSYAVSSKVFWGGAKPTQKGLSRKHVTEAAHAALKRLRVDAIDLLYQHRVDPNVPIEDVAGTVKDLIAAGTVKHFGLSEAGAHTIRRANAVLPVTAVQSEYSLWTRQHERDILPTLEELGIGFVPFSPLGKGFLTGAITEHTELASNDFRASLPRFTPEARKANQAMVDLLAAIGQRKQATPAQIALAWVLAQKPWMVPIPGTTKPHRLVENIGAAAITLTADDLRDIEEAASTITIHGARYPDAIEKMTGL